MTRTIILTGARGGQGTSTVAVAIAVLAAKDGPTLLRSSDPAATGALLGVPLPLAVEQVEVCPGLTFAMSARAHDTAPYEVVVIDGGRNPAGPAEVGQPPRSGPQEPSSGDVNRYTVLRGPCCERSVSVAVCDH